MYHTTGLYLVARAVLDATPPDAGYSALHCPDDDTMCLVSVFCWNSISAQHAWEDRPDVTTLHPEEMGGNPHPRLLAGFGRAHGLAGGGLTQRQALKKIRASWPGLHL